MIYYLKKYTNRVCSCFNRIILLVPYHERMVVLVKKHEKVEGYKGFKHGLIGRNNTIYAENEVFEEKAAKVGKRGIHFLKEPLRVWSHYYPCGDRGVLNDFARVESCGEEVLVGDDGILCTTKLKIGNKLNLKEFVEASEKELKEDHGHFFMSNCGKLVVNEEEDVLVSEGENDLAMALFNLARFSEANGYSNYGLVANIADFAVARSKSGGYKSVVTNLGDGSYADSDETCGIVANTGVHVYAKSTGNNSIVANTGADSALRAEDKGSIIANTASRSSLESKGDRAMIVTNGMDTSASSYGKHSVIICSGRESTAAACGENSIAFAINGSKAKGELGCFLVCAEYGANQEIKDVKTAYVDGEKIKPNTFYVLRDGEFKEAP